MKTVTDYSSPSQLEVQDMTTVHRVPDVSPKVLNALLWEKGYKLEERIGSGAYATVFKARVLFESNQLKVNDIIACKVVDISQTKDSVKRTEEVKNELFVLEKIKHPNIIEMYEHFIVNKHYLYIFMAYASGGDLSKHLQQFGPFNENECRFLFQQIVSGVAYLHQKRVAHRDLKLQNILLMNEQKTALITDFGLSQVSYRSDKPGRKGGIWNPSQIAGKGFKHLLNCVFEPWLKNQNQTLVSTLLGIEHNPQHRTHWSVDHRNWYTHRFERLILSTKHYIQSIKQFILYLNKYFYSQILNKLKPF